MAGRLRNLDFLELRTLKRDCGASCCIASSAVAGGTVEGTMMGSAASMVQTEEALEVELVTMMLEDRIWS